MDVIRFSADGAGGEACVRFDGADPLFAGHFPSAPVLPGVALIDAAVSLVSRALGRPLKLRRVAHVKFVSVVEPGQEISLAFKLAQEACGDEPVTVSARWARGAERVAEMSFVVAPDEAQGAAP
jgi:3-hydroxymyristoyl/3-hydroxydecanoyl-(acyl carrier protein) dehydratase